MGLRIETVTNDAVDPEALAAFCAPRSPGSDGWTRTATSGSSGRRPSRRRHGPSPAHRAGPRVEGREEPAPLDLVPDDQEREVERLESLGATRPDIGQSGNESWVVLADPEGNEFCVLDEPDLVDG